MLPTGYVNQSDSSPSNISQEGSETQSSELSLTYLTLYISPLDLFLNNKFEQYSTRSPLSYKNIKNIKKGQLHVLQLIGVKLESGDR